MQLIRRCWRSAGSYSDREQQTDRRNIWQILMKRTRIRRTRWQKIRRKAIMRMSALSAGGRKAKPERCSSFPIIFVYVMTVCIRPWILWASLIIRVCWILILWTAWIRIWVKRDFPISGSWILENFREREVSPTHRRSRKRNSYSSKW